METGRLLAPFVVLAALATGCGENPVGPDANTQVAGTWNARFEGTVQGRGTSQIDRFAMELRQSGSSVTGTLRFSDLAVSVTGQVEGATFTYIARAPLAPGCEAIVSAQTTVAGGGTRFIGSQTQSTCEGTAVGQVSAMRQ